MIELTHSLALSLLLLAPAATQEAPAPPGSAPRAIQTGSAPRATQEAARVQEHAPEDPRERRKKRLLRTRSGEVIRGVTRWVDDHWEVSRGGEWRALPEDAIASYREEAEVLTEKRELARGVGAGDDDRRVALASWMLEQGLEEEGLAELDRVLRSDPDHARAVTLLRESHLARPRGGDPRTEPELVVRRLFTAALDGKPTRRELCVQALGEVLEVEGGRELLLEHLATELRSYRVLRRVTAAHALRRLLPGEEVYELSRRCALDTSRPVRESCARALRATDEPGIITPLVKALGSESRAVRTNAAESLGHVGFAVAVPALVSHFAALPQSGGGSTPHGVAANIFIGRQFAYVGDYDVEIAQGASISDPIVKVGSEGAVLDARLGGISGYTYQTEYRVVHQALRQLTGEKIGSSPADWERWMQRNQDRFRDPRAD